MTQEQSPLTEDEKQILLDIAVVRISRSSTVANVMERFIGPVVVGDDVTQRENAFVIALRSLQKKELVNVSDGNASTCELTTAGEEALGQIQLGPE